MAASCGSRPYLTNVAGDPHPAVVVVPVLAIPRPVTRELLLLGGKLGPDLAQAGVDLLRRLAGAAALFLAEQQQLAFRVERGHLPFQFVKKLGDEQVDAAARKFSGDHAPDLRHVNRPVKSPGDRRDHGVGRDGDGE